MNQHDSWPHLISADDVPSLFRRFLSGGQVFLAACLFITTAATAGIQDHADLVGQSLFESDSVLHLRLVTDFKTLLKGKERSATLTYNTSGGDSVALALKVATVRKEVDTHVGMRLPVTIYLEGRRKICEFPVLSLDIEEKQTQGTVFENQDKLKLLTHCQDDEAEYEQYVLQQYLMYRTLNLITDWSFRVRLARVTYVDAAGKRDSLTKYAVLIEDEHRLAVRLGGEILDMKGLHPLDLDPETMVTMALFQYMILNTDWGVSGLHNVKLVAYQNVAYPVPFDFAWSGIIGAPFAKPHDTLPIANVRDPLYRGFCRPSSESSEPLARFNRQKEAIYAMLRNQEGLEPKVLERMLNDYDGCYDVINDAQQMEREILTKCRPDTR